MSLANGQANVSSQSWLSQARAPFVGELSLQDLSLGVHAGEIVGLVGVVGSDWLRLPIFEGTLFEPERGLLTRAKDVVYIPEHRWNDMIRLVFLLKHIIFLLSHRTSECTRANYLLNVAEV